MRTQQTQSSGDSVHTMHQPVLLQESLDWLDVQSNDIVFDGTLGGAGHARALSKLLGSGGTFIGTDVDSTAITRAQKALVNVDATLILAHTNFKNIKDVCKINSITHINKALLDLGWSSDQISERGKGMSFLVDEPLSMRLADTEEEDPLTAYEIVNNWEEESIADVLYGWGGERYSRKIAAAIVNSRTQQPIKTTFELVEIIKNATPKSYQHGKLHPATKTFQALRIAVNDELQTLKETLSSIKDLLAVNGRVVIISFHSGEDRIVKHTFKEWEKQGDGKMLTKKPVVATEEEVKENTRSRSAKLRIFEKI